jgi:hypothetical protein
MCVCDIAPTLLTVRNKTALNYLKQITDTILMNGIHLIGAAGATKKKYRLGPVHQRSNPGPKR